MRHTIRNLPAGLILVWGILFLNSLAHATLPGGQERLSGMPFAVTEDRMTALPARVDALPATKPEVLRLAGSWEAYNERNVWYVSHKGDRGNKKSRVLTTTSEKLARKTAKKLNKAEDKAKKKKDKGFRDDDPGLCDQPGVQC